MSMNFWGFAVLALLLGACGFTPMYGQGAGAPGIAPAAGLSRVDIAAIPDAEGVFLRNALIDRFYRDGWPQDPLYTLKVNPVREQRVDFDITRESEATRRQLRLTTVMILTDRATGQAVLQRSLFAVTSYNVLESEFATRITEEDARQAALDDLARQIEQQVSLYLKR